MAVQYSLETIWRDLSVHLRRFIRQRVPDEAAADDILQDVFVRVHTHIDTLRDDTRLESWLYQITRNAIADYYRARRVLLPMAEIAKDEPKWEAEPARELASSLRSMIAQLPPAYREAIILSDLEGMSQVTLAKRLGLSVSGAKSRVQRARAKLKQMLLGCCHFEFDRRGG